VSKISDRVKFTMRLYDSPLETMFTAAPFMDPSSPESLLNTTGLIAPRILKVWEIKSESFSGLDFS